MPTDIAEVEQYDETVDGPAGGEPRTSASVRAMGAKIVNRTKWLAARLAQLLGLQIKISGVSASTDKVTTTAAHGLAADDPVRFISVGGSPPGGLTAGTVYYVLADTSTTFKVSATPGGVAIDLTTAGSGTLYAYKVIDSLAALFAPAVGGLPAGSLRSILAAIPALAAANLWTGAQAFDSLTMTGTARIQLEPRVVARASELAITPDGYTNWMVEPSVLTWKTLVDTASILYCPLHIPHGATLESVTVNVKGAPGHVGLPATMPTVKVWRINVTTLTKTQIGSTATDLSADTAAYQLPHSIEVTMSHVVDRTVNRYLVQVTSESGGNALASSQFTACIVTYSAAAYDED